MDNIKKERWYHKWGQNIVAPVIVTVIGGIILAFILEYEKTKLALISFFTSIKIAWNFLIKINITLGWFLMTIIIVGLIWVIFKRTKLYSNFFDKEYALL